MNASELNEAVKGYMDEAWFPKVSYLDPVVPQWYSGHVHLSPEEVESRIGWAVLGELLRHGVSISEVEEGPFRYKARYAMDPPLMRGPEGGASSYIRGADTLIAALLSALDAVKGAKRG